MLPETQRELTRMAFEHLDAGTTAMAPDGLRNPVTAYIDPERFEQESAALFRTYPLLVGLTCLAPEAGDYFVDDLAGVPVLVVRGSDGVLRAFFNVCRHRGSRVVEGRGSAARSFSCPYHAWTYDTSGRLMRIPCREGFADVDVENTSLTELPLVERHGLIWVVPSEGNAPDIDAQLGGLAPELASYGLEGYSHFGTATLTPEINWKVGIDTFLEAYHLAILHPTTVGPLYHNNLSLSDGFGLNHRMVAIRKTFEKMRGAADVVGDFLTHTIQLYTLFPNVMFIHQADHIEIWRSFPRDGRVDASSVELSLYVPEPVTSDSARRYWQANMDLALDTVDREDFRLSERIQRGYGSGAQSHLTYGRNEPALIHFHRSIRQALGLDRVGQD